MDKFKAIWMGSLGVLVLIGIMIALINISSTKYYQQQYYNNLPSMQSYETPKPEPIQHYEEMRDKSVEKTEEINVVERLPNNSSFFSSFNDNRMIIYNNDNSFDFMAIAFLSGIIIGIYHIIRKTIWYILPKPREMYCAIISIIMAIVMLNILVG